MGSSGVGTVVEATAAGRPLVFALNGKRVDLPEVDPALTLLNYIRTWTSFRGTKRGCGEGGCGACVVFLSRFNPRNRKIEELTINSCLTLLCSIDGCAITTTEGLGNQRTGHHAIHKRLSGFHASQCGFCTPGMAMALYGTLRNSLNHTVTNGSQENGHDRGCLTLVDAERSVAGNLCRCTGYRPILDTCKSFSSEVDFEDLGLHQFHNKNDFPAYDPTHDPIFPQFLIEEYEAREQGHSVNTKSLPVYGGGAIHQENTHTDNEVNEDKLSMGPLTRFKCKDGEDTTDGERVWIDPRNLTEVFEAMEKFQGQHEVKLVVGNTSSGYYKDIKSEVFINIAKVNELVSVTQQSKGIEIGAAVSITNFIELLENFDRERAKDRDGGATPEHHDESISLALASHLKKVATSHVRNWGSVGGNLIMAQQYGFESDVATILLGASACVKLVSRGANGFVLEDLTLEEFLMKGGLEKGKLLQSVWIPLIADVCQGTQVFFKTFRAAPRPLGNALAYINAAFSARVLEGNKKRVVEVRIAVGAFGTRHAIRARSVERFLAGKSLTRKVVLEAIELLKNEIIPVKGTSKAKYRVSIAGGFLFKFFNPLLEVDQAHQSGISQAPYENGLLNTGKQSMTLSDEHYPVGQPAAKVASELQASGEAIFVDDIPSPENCLCAAFVYSHEALAKVQHVDVESALKAPGTVAFVSHGDIPPSGKNIGINAGGVAQEKLFATELVEFVGHLLGVMVADTYEHAKEAAERVKVEYNTSSVGPPVLTVEDAVARGSTFPVHMYMANATKGVGDYAKGLSEADLVIENFQVSTNSQKHFYLETQTALAIPDEDGCMVVYCSTQAPGWVQSSISSCLGIPMHNVRVITRRAGGAFGGKVFRTCATFEQILKLEATFKISPNLDGVGLYDIDFWIHLQIAVACALAAHKLQRPVRTSLDRNTDTIVSGGRSPTRSTFTVGFTKEGKITALKAQILIEAGWSPEFSSLLPGPMSHSFKKYNWGNFEVEYKICKTNTVPKSTMRAPGDAQGSFLADSVIEQVAAKLGLDPDIVREQNLHDQESLVKFFGEGAVGDITTYTLPKMWERLKTTGNWEERNRAVKAFNEASVWVKRGLAMIPIIYHVITMASVAMVSIFNDGSVVVEVGGVEMGQGLYTKVRQTAAFTLSQLWPQGRGVDASKVRVVQADTISTANGGLTSSSTTSESSCAAVQQACESLVERLAPLKMKVEENAADGQVSWETLISKAQMLDLKAHARYTPKSGVYLNYGAAVSEVEIDTLTGETQILATDLIYDCGKSLNPAIDLGQIEGAFTQGIGFYLTENVESTNGKLVSSGTWTYKIPTADLIPKRFHVELYNSPAQRDRFLSSKASGEPPLLMAGSIHSAIRKAIKSARSDRARWESSTGVRDKMKDNFRLDVPATMERIKELCGFGNVESYLEAMATRELSSKEQQ